MVSFEMSTTALAVPHGANARGSRRENKHKPEAESFVRELSPVSVQREEDNIHSGSGNSANGSFPRPASCSPEGRSSRGRPRLALQTDPLGFSPVRHITTSYRIRSSRPRKHEYSTVANGEEMVDSDDGDGHYLVDGDTLILQGHHSSRPNRKRQWILCGAMGCGGLLITLLTLNVLLLLSKSYDNQPDPDAIFGNWGRPGTSTEGLAWYPTDFLRDVVPIPCHSHNDYWRKVPLFSALHAGCISVEADVFEVGLDSLLVGHSRSALHPNRTFASLYIDPLVDLLTRTNAPPLVASDAESANQPSPRNGVFDMQPHQTLVLLVDFKTDGYATYDKVWEQLAPLRSRGWLTTYTAGVGVVEGPVTVVASGSAAFSTILQHANGTRRTQRDIFFDAPLHELEGDRPGDRPDQYDRTNSYYASVRLSKAVGSVWLGGLRRSQLRRVRRQLRAAHDRGLVARYWSLPAWPIHYRNEVWEQLANEGLDMLNVDDLVGAAKRDWTKDSWI